MTPQSPVPSVSGGTGRNGPTTWTVGHSTRTANQLAGLLAAHHIEHVVDVRSYPTSKRQPWFVRAQLEQWLPEVGVTYTWLPELGGRRPDQGVGRDVNGGWENPSFRHYADYMQSAGFALGLAQLRRLADTHRVAYMCSEAVPYRCHRSLISDALTAHGWTVLHITSNTSTRLHELGKWGAVPDVHDGQVTYPSQQLVLA